jgi:hypothetical protein
MEKEQVDVGHRRQFPAAVAAQCDDSAVGWCGVSGDLARAAYDQVDYVAATGGDFGSAETESMPDAQSFRFDFEEALEGVELGSDGTRGGELLVGVDEDLFKVYVHEAP